jgi:hypothetical protein
MTGGSGDEPIEVPQFPSAGILPKVMASKR